MAEQAGDEELRRRLEEELARLKVSDLLVQTMYTISALGSRKLTPDERDLDQARLAIDSLRALQPVLEGAVPAEVAREFGQVTANMQLAYAKAAAESPGNVGEEDGSAERGEPAGQPAGEQADGG